MGIRTDLLSDVQAWEVVHAMIEFLKSKQITNVTAFYGFSCKTKHTYEPIPIRTDDIETFLLQSTLDKNYIFNQDELLIETVTPKMLFILCHESDVHFESIEKETDEEVADLWKRMGLSVFTYQS